MTLKFSTADDGMALAAQIARKEVSVREAVDDAITEIERQNPNLNAVVAERFEQARLEASQMDRERPAHLGPLWGVPFLLKDVNLYSSALPTRYASRFFETAQPRGDSTIVRRWQQGGLVVLGTTNTPEFAGDFTTEPLAYGPCRNPWNPDLTVGGSSGGAAAAVASGMVRLAHGTDLGGSIRIPAACCGVFGFKPSVGLNPLGPWTEEIAGGLDSDHVLARSVRDSAAALDLTAGPDVGTRVSWRPPENGFLAALKGDLPPLRIGVTVRDALGRIAGPDQVNSVWRVAGLLESMGHRIEEYTYPEAAQSGDWFEALWTVDILQLVLERAEELGRDPEPDELEPMTWAFMEMARKMSALEHIRARQKMVAAARALGQSMADIDLVLSPALAEDPPRLGSLTFQGNGCDLARWAQRGYGFAPFSTPANLAGQPSAALSVALSSTGLPLAVQITGRPGADALVLCAAQSIEAAI